MGRVRERDKIKGKKTKVWISKTGGRADLGSRFC